MKWRREFVQLRYRFVQCIVTGLRSLYFPSSRCKVTLSLLGTEVETVGFMKPWGHLVSLPPCLLTVHRSNQLSITLSPLSVSRLAEPPSFALRNKRVNSSNSRPSCATISGAEKGETVCRKREEGKRASVYFECWSACGSWKFVFVCVCVRAPSLVTERRPIWRSQTTQLVFLAPQEKKAELSST